MTFVANVSADTSMLYSTEAIGFTTAFTTVKTSN